MRKYLLFLFVLSVFLHASFIDERKVDIYFAKKRIGVR